MTDPTGNQPWPQTYGPPSGTELTDAEAGFADICTAFEKATARCPESLREFSCVFAGRSVRVRTVGRTLGEVAARALDHLLVASPGPDPQLSIELWDGAETGVGWRMPAARNGLGIDYWLALSNDQRYVAMERHRELTWFDRKAGRIVGWITDARQFNLAEQARIAYFPIVLWLHDRGLSVIHASLIACDGRGLLLTAGTGQGKSTASLSCLLGGLDFLSDDHVWLEPGPGGQFLGHALYGSVNLRPEDFRNFPALQPHAIHGRRGVEDKSLVFLSPLFPGRVKGTAPIHAVAIPQVIGSEKSCFCATPRIDVILTVVYGSMVEWSFKRMPNAADRFERIGRLVESVPCFLLELGQDLSDIPRCVRSMLREASP
jgi:hypothetical protein